MSLVARPSRLGHDTPSPSAVVVRHVVYIKHMQLLLFKTASVLFQDDINISDDTSDDEEYVIDNGDVPTDDELSDFPM